MSKQAKGFLNAQILLQVDETGDTRIVIDGDPGAGKTTFVKRVCYIWAQSVLHPKQVNKGDEMLLKYALVLPIILRFITKEDTVIDILTSQLQCLNMCEICSLCKIIEAEPKNLLLLLDGYDEYTGSSVLSKIITKEQLPYVLIITTSRPHGVEQLRRLTSHAVNQHVRLCGFSTEQVHQYINQFFELYRSESDTSSELIETLFNQRKKLLEVAQVPIRCEMICIVWARYQKLGETLAELYELFVKHLFAHWEEKQQIEVINPNEQLLLRVGKVANTWEKYGRLHIVFDTAELLLGLNHKSRYHTRSPDISCKCNFCKVIDIGLIVKSHPSNALEDSKWSFPHLTIQEYFVAYFLGNQVENRYVDEFAARCKDFRVLQRSEVIFMILCSRFPDAANKIFSLLVRQETEGKACLKLLQFILKQMEYLDNSKINIPMPQDVNLQSLEIHFHSNRKTTIDVMRKSVNMLLLSEKRQENSNLISLSLCSLSEYTGFLSLPQLQKLDVFIQNQNALVLFNRHVNNLKSLESLSVESKVRFSVVDIISNLPAEHLTYLSLSGPDAIDAVARSVQKISKLEQLCVHDDSKYYGRETINTLMSSLTSCAFLKKVSVSVLDIDDMFVNSNINMEVNLKIMKLQGGSLKKAVNILDVTLSLYELDLSGNNLKEEGNSLGQIMVKVTALQVLSVGNCNIRASTVEQIFATITNISIQNSNWLPKMKSFHINGNNLHMAGSSFGKLLALMKELSTITLARCNLISSDLSETAAVLQTSTNITTLDISCNNLGYVNGGGAELIQLMPNLEALSVGGNEYEDPTPAICKAAESGQLTNIRILDMCGSEFNSGSLQALSQQLQKMENLHILNLDGISGADEKEYSSLFQSIPRSLKHLNIRTEDSISGSNVISFFALDPYKILEHKLCLYNLDKLNVNMEESDVELLQELLEQKNPDIHVYNEASEETWVPSALSY